MAAPQEAVSASALIVTLAALDVSVPLAPAAHEHNNAAARNADRRGHAFFTLHIMPGTCRDVTASRTTRLRIAALTRFVRIGPSNVSAVLRTGDVNSPARAGPRREST